MTPELTSIILEELRAFRSELVSIKTLQAAHNVSLDTHMRRSDHLEKLLETQSGRLKPLEAHVAGWAGIGKGLAILGTISAIGVGLLTLTKFLMG